jgi:hypothetical protein
MHSLWMSCQMNILTGQHVRFLGDGQLTHATRIACSKDLIAVATVPQADGRGAALIKLFDAGSGAVRSTFEFFASPYGMCVTTGGDVALSAGERGISVFSAAGTLVGVITVVTCHLWRGG